MRAVLVDAIRCVADARPGRRRVAEAARARRWIAARDRDWPFSFERICEALDVDPDHLRRRLRAGVAAIATEARPAGRRRRSVDSTVRDHIVRMIEAGAPPRAIAATYGTTIQAVSRVAREFAGHVAVARDAEVRRLRTLGWTLTALAARFGLSRSRIVQLCRLEAARGERIAPRGGGLDGEEARREQLNGPWR
jgi:AraC-like DNA-binding protein